VTRLAALAAVALAVAVAGCGGGGGSETTTTSAGPPLFDYDASANLGYRDAGVVPNTNPKVHDVSFTSPRGGRVPGYLTVPPGKGPFPAVIFLHGSGGTRRNFVSEASWLSGRNVVGLTIDSPFVRPRPTLTGMPGIRQERNLEAQAVVDTRRAVDVLDSLPYVDKNRIGLLGFSAGAKTAAVAAGVDPRLKATVIVSGGAPPVESFVDTAPAKFRSQIRSLLTSIDPYRYVGKAKGKLLIQIGRADEEVTQGDLGRMVNAAGVAEVKRYDAGHTLVTNATAIRDELDWLAKELDAHGTVPGALTGPVNG
jgi:dienelactone hydrolase